MVGIEMHDQNIHRTRQEYLDNSCGRVVFTLLNETIHCIKECAAQSKNIRKINKNFLIEH